MGPHGNRRAPRFAAVTYGTAELRPDPARPAGWTLLVDDVPQSYVDLADPEHLEFPYMRMLGKVVRPGHAARVLHLGGGGLTMPRLVRHRRPGSVQRVVERDPRLIELVSRFLPFPESIVVEVGDARRALEAAPAGAYDLIISDVFEGAAMPRAVGTGGFAAAARRALTPDGLLAVNLTDVPPLAHTRVQAATFRSAFAEVALLGDPVIFRGRRAGNIILLAGDVPMIKSDKHEHVVDGTDLAEFIGGAKARLDEPA
jgi:spermidine synthase